MDLGHIFGNNNCIKYVVIVKAKTFHKPVFDYAIALIQYFVINTDLIEYIIVGDTKAPLLRCFFCTSKLNIESFITTGQYLSYQIFSNLQNKPLKINFFIFLFLENEPIEKLEDVY